MKKLLVLLALVIPFIFPSHIFAKVIIQETGTVTIPSTEVIDDDLFIAAENVIIEGNVTGDVFVGTGNLTLSGANIGDSLIVGAGSVTTDATSKIGGSLIVGAGTLRNSAPVGRNIIAGAGTIYLDSKVGKEARLGGGVIDLGPNSEISGNLTYALGEDESELNQNPSSTVAGSVSRYTPPVDAKRNTTRAKDDFGKFGRVFHSSWLVVSFLGSILVGFIILKLFPKTFLGLSTQVSTQLLPSLGFGFLVIVFSVPILLVLALSIIGLPLAGLLLLLLCIELHLAKLVTSYALGRFVVAQFNWNKMGVYATYFVGLAIFYLLRAIPGIGWVATILFTWVGLGSIWLYTRSHLKNL